MSGMPGRSGGARPGAGVKSPETRERQQAHRDVLLTLAEQPFRLDENGDLIVDIPVLTIAAAMGLAQMRNAIHGDSLAFNAIAAHIFGGKPTAPLITIEGDLNVNQQAVIWGIAWKPPELTPAEGQPVLIEAPEPDL